MDPRGLFMLYASLLVVGQLLLGGRLKKTKVRIWKTSGREPVFLLIAALMGFLYFLFDVSLMMPVPLRIFGGVVAVCGLGITWAAQCQLGDNWIPGVGIKKKGHTLVMTGLYARVRHPLYTGLLVGAIGMALVTNDTLAGLSLFVHWLSLVIRIPYEEAMLKYKFGATYTEYEARTGTLFPKFRR